MFPLVRNREEFKVNGTNTELYKKSVIPYLQRKSNTYFTNLTNDRKGSDIARRERPGSQ